MPWNWFIKSKWSQCTNVLRERKDREGNLRKGNIGWGQNIDGGERMHSNISRIYWERERERERERRNIVGRMEN